MTARAATTGAQRQLICDPDAYPTCPCTDGEQFSCDCNANEEGTACAGCDAMMICIDIDSGERVEA